MRRSEDRYLHISHPHPVPMADILLPLSEALDLPLVPYSNWLHSLEAAASQEFTAPANPGVRLLDFFRSYQDVSHGSEAFFPATLSNTRTVMVAGSIQSLAPLGAQDVEAWVCYLRQVGYLS